jgi:hypothetical protein
MVALFKIVLWAFYLYNFLLDMVKWRYKHEADQDIWEGIYDSRLHIEAWWSGKITLMHQLLFMKHHATSLSDLENSRLGRMSVNYAKYLCQLGKIVHNGGTTSKFAHCYGFVVRM